MAGGQRLMKAITGLTGYPLRYLPEGPLKHAIRRRMLSVQHRLPRPLLVNRGDTLILVGTPNPGTVRRYSRLAGRRGRVVVVEADAANVLVLEGALESLPRANTTIVPLGAWNERATVAFLRSPISSDHRIAVSGMSHDNDYRAENTAYERVEIQVDTLDRILSGIGVSRANALVVTVNGAELQVLEGASALLRAHSPRVFAKGHARNAEGRPINAAICQLLEQHGYRTIISRGERAVGTNPEWRTREGDVFAYKP